MFSAGTPATLLRAAAGFRTGAARDGAAGGVRRSAGSGARLLGHHLLGRLVLPQALERGVAEQTVGGPRPELDFGDELRPDPLREITGDITGRPAAVKNGALSISSG